MELSRLKRVVRERWWVVGLIAILGFVGGFGFTLLGNRDIQENHLATIPLVFEPGEGETADSIARQVEDAGLLANFAAEDLLAQFAGSSITPDTLGGQLLFRASAETPQEALSRANQLVSAYFSTDPTVGGNVDDQLEDLRAEAEELDAQIAALQPALTPEQQDALLRHEILDLRTDTIRNAIVTLASEAANLDQSQTGPIDAQIEDLTARLAAIQAERAALGPRPVETLTPTEDLQLRVLQRRLEIVQLDYERYALRAFGVGEQGRLEASSVVDLTPQPAAPAVNGILGLVLGAGLATLSLGVLSRWRQEIWLAYDVPVPVLAEIPHRKIAPAPGPPWYDATPSGTRKQAIQAARTAIDGLIDPASDGISISGHKADKGGVHSLAVDLAVSFASVGRSVLLIDAAFDVATTVSEYDVGEPSLGRLLMKGGAGDPVAHVDAALDEVIFIRTDLALMSAGPAPDSPADALAGRVFRVLLESARDRFDLVLVVAGDADSATAQVVSQRVGTAIVAVQRGRSTAPEVGSLISELDQQRVNVPGTLMMTGIDVGSGPKRDVSLIKREVPQLRVTRRSEPVRQDLSATSRLGSYPFPGEKRVGNRRDGSLAHLSQDLKGASPVERETGTSSATAAPPAQEPVIQDPPPAEPGPGGADVELGREVLHVLTRANPVAARRRVAEYVVARVEDILTAVPGQESLSDDLINVMATDGFIVIRGPSSHRTIGDFFAAELELELGTQIATELMEVFVNLLDVRGPSKPAALNRWIEREFFPRHIKRSDGAPKIWQLSSSHGSVVLLINSQKLTDDRLKLITTDVVRRRINELEREARDGAAGLQEGGLEDIDARLRELHEFEVALGLLRVGGNEDAKLRYPWRRVEGQPNGWQPVWSEGIEPNIAPLQRLGMLSAPVLSQEQLQALSGS